jgi:hypothetical protein
MKPQMNLLYLNTTGHVLSGFTRRAEPNAVNNSVESFVGDGLLVNGFGFPDVTQAFVIPLSQIDLFRTDLDLGLMVHLRNLFLTDPDGSPKLQLISNSPLTPSATNKEPIVIKLPDKAIADITVLVLVQPTGQTLPSPSAIIPAKIRAATKEVSLNVPGLDAGHYDALIFVAGYPVNGIKFEVP